MKACGMVPTYLTCLCIKACGMKSLHMQLKNNKIGLFNLLYIWLAIVYKRLICHYHIKEIYLLGWSTDCILMELGLYQPLIKAIYILYIYVHLYTVNFFNMYTYDVYWWKLSTVNDLVLTPGFESCI